jgi:hypothetical protein
MDAAHHSTLRRAITTAAVSLCAATMISVLTPSVDLGAQTGDDDSTTTYASRAWNKRTM